MLITSVSSTLFSRESSKQDSLKSRSSASKILPEGKGDSICCHLLLFLTLESKMRLSFCFGFAHFASSGFCAGHSHIGRRPTRP